ncbi:alanine/ornithine racemase family PLP-dependent enzyme [filamentous cyanobacterium LEGE 11480]|uniref:Alanine/ornithine racemase family PLP-dependent enzyme n=1 Tax=Romeriopsis navalis LEGE 11480 TaxID=2777977 RepID=A0A928Z2L1_9CYAN|nr:alanine/ornithine racemase family PLP-dependent enzyme [Romeriopsis navalis]MBE9028490.1 alanine/ornithine racemase family PLP-dependent enzyme [Romeriopsis navalis LEGE 11480]
MKSYIPRIEISLAQIQQNAHFLSELYGQKGISLMGVSKSTLGDPAIAQAMMRGGVKYIADSRLENIQRMQQAGVNTQFVLLRTALSQAEWVAGNVDISLNTEFATVQALSQAAAMWGKVHHIILMVELGDLREGILPSDLGQFVQATLRLSHIKIVGIGCNLACFGGVKPDNQKMQILSELVAAIEESCQIDLPIVSGGNSANHEWYAAARQVGRINNLRLGEAILLGCETVNRQPIDGLHTSAFQLIAEVIESKDKPSMPTGEICQDAFGHVPQFVDRGIRRRVIIGIGRQDMLISGLKPDSDVEILGASSDHVVLDSQNQALMVGSEVNFNLDYGGLLAAMTSPFIKKKFIDCPVF